MSSERFRLALGDEALEHEYVLGAGLSVNVATDLALGLGGRSSYEKYRSVVV